MTREIAQETKAFALGLVAPEEHMRRAQKLLGENLHEGGPNKEAAVELKAACEEAGKLPRLLYDWTGSEQVQDTQQVDLDKPSHINFMEASCAFGTGTAALVRAVEFAEKPGQGSKADAIEQVTIAMGAICGTHRDLRDRARAIGVPLPYIPTTKSGGGR